MKKVISNTIQKVYQKSAIIRIGYRSLRKAYLIPLLKRTINQKLTKNKPIKVVLGSSRKFQEGWIPTEIYLLNMLNPHDWERYFPPESIDALLAEHVWEHLTREEGVIAANNMFKYLRPGGYLRVAVPDGFFMDQKYLGLVKPGGSGPGAQDHKILYNYKTLREVFGSAGFEVFLLEYYDEKGNFHYKEWDPDDGKIVRSTRFYDGNTSLFKYSLILDAKKQNIS